MIVVMTRTVFALLFIAVIGTPQDKTKHASHRMVMPDSLQWKPVASGMSMALLSGSLETEGAPFAFRLKLVDGTKVPPHWHPVDEHLTVISGIFYMSTGETVDESAETTMTAGAFATMPKEVRHFARASGDTVVQIHGVGPFKTYFVTREARVPYPVDFRTWAVVKTTVVNPPSKLFAVRGGIHHFYANEKAMEGYRTGAFPEGSVIVDEGAHVEEKDGIVREGERRSVEVMHKDSSRFSQTGGWGYERFEGNRQASESTLETRTACYSCHAGKKSPDFVFSQFRK